MSFLAKEYNDLKMQLLKEYYHSLNEMEREKYIELNAAVNIQKNVRKLLCRKRFLLMKEVALEIQRNFYGYMARANHIENIKGLSNDKNMQFFEFHALIIQKHWQGFKCRRNKLDYQERRKYLQMIKHKNEETLLKLQEYSKGVQYEMEVNLMLIFLEKTRRGKQT